MANSEQGGNAPSWLFSFVDLAFLMLIAMTQLAEDTAELRPELGEIVVPRIESKSSEPLPMAAAERWQVRVHPRDAGSATPFELVRVEAGRPTPGERLDAPTLRERLAAHRAEFGRKPLLAPHEDSRSRDLLDAVAVLDDLWPRRRRVTVSPRLAAR